MPWVPVCNPNVVLVHVLLSPAATLAQLTVARTRLGFMNLTVGYVICCRAGFDPRMALHETQAAKVDELLEDPAALQAADAVVVPRPTRSLLNIDAQAIRRAERRQEALAVKEAANLARALQETSKIYAEHDSKLT